jgi:hypothetical protein
MKPREEQFPDKDEPTTPKSSRLEEARQIIEEGRSAPDHREAPPPSELRRPQLAVIAGRALTDVCFWGFEKRRPNLTSGPVWFWRGPLSHLHLSHLMGCGLV